MWREHKSALALLLFATARNLEIRESVIFIRFQESLTSGAPAKRFYRFSTRSTPPVLPNPLLYNTGGIYYAYHRTTYFRPDLTVKTRRLPGLHISPTIMSLFLNFAAHLEILPIANIPLDIEWSSVNERLLYLFIISSYEIT